MPTDKKPCGIIIPAPLIPGVMAGQITLFSEVIKPQPPEWVSEMGWTCCTPNGKISGRGNYQDQGPAEKFFRCPYFVGQRLYLKEPYALQGDCDGDDPPFSDGRPLKRWGDPDYADRWAQPHYRATDPPPDLCCERERCKCCAEGEPGPHWKPAILMPRWAARTWLDVTAVRPARCQEITEEEAEASGITGQDALVGQIVNPYRTAYAALWDQLNARKGFPWDGNWWTWRVSVKLTQKGGGE